MTNSIDYRMLAQCLVKTVHSAGCAEMEIYRQDFTVESKADRSPVTEADRVAENIILEDLAKIAPDIPVVAEEAASEGHIPKTGKRFFLVDPLDGTKEFIRKSDEFTVNIGLIENGKPVFGIVYAPATGKLFFTTSPDEAFYTTMSPNEAAPEFDKMTLTRLSTKPPSADGLDVVASKSHMTEETRRYIEQFSVKELKSAGSSLKFCLLAKGEADLYPRFGPTMEWDTAAGHAVLLAAGGVVLMENGEPLEYGKANENYRNPFFIAWAKI